MGPAAPTYVRRSTGGKKRQILFSSKATTAPNGIIATSRREGFAGALGQAQLSGHRARRLLRSRSASRAPGEANVCSSSGRRWTGQGVARSRRSAGLGLRTASQRRRLQIEGAESDAGPLALVRLEDEAVGRNPLPIVDGRAVSVADDAIRVGVQRVTVVRLQEVHDLIAELHDAHEPRAKARVLCGVRGSLHAPRVAHDGRLSSISESWLLRGPQRVRRPPQLSAA